MNTFTATGRLTADPDTKEANGKQLCQFTLACNRSFKKEGQPEADFFYCNAWGTTGEFISKWFKKGDGIELTGFIQIRQWEDKEGNKRSTTEVTVERASFNGSKSNSNTGNQSKPKQSVPAKISNSKDEDEDLPF